MPLTFRCLPCGAGFDHLDALRTHIETTPGHIDLGASMRVDFSSHKPHAPVNDDYTDARHPRPEHRHSSNARLHTHPGGDVPHRHDWAAEALASIKEDQR